MVGYKTGPFDYLEHPIPLVVGELGKQDFYVLKGGPLVGKGVSDPVKVRLNQFYEQLY